MLAEYNRKQADDNKEELNTANTELHNLIAKISTVIKLVSETGIAIETVKVELRELEERKLYLEKYIKELALRNRETLITEGMILELINQSKDFVKTKNLAECRQFIKTYIKKVVVYSEKAEVMFNISIPNDTVDAVEPLKSAEDTKVLQREYKAVLV